MTLNLRKRVRDKAFTLTELVVVLIIIAIVALIGFPTFLSLIEQSRLRGIENTALAYDRDVRAIAAFDVDKAFPLGVPYNGKYLHGDDANAAPGGFDFVTTGPDGENGLNVAVGGAAAELPNGYTIADLDDDATSNSLDGDRYITIWRQQAPVPGTCEAGEYSAVIVFPGSTGSGETVGSPAFVTTDADEFEAFTGQTVAAAGIQDVGICTG